MKLVVGLGNPGREHDGTRHNAGFWWVDRLARSGTSSFGRKRVFHGQAAKLIEAGRECWLLKPNTFMNLSGARCKRSPSSTGSRPRRSWWCTTNLICRPGGGQAQKGGGVAGHNGLKDIAVHLGPDFWRLRIGIGHPGDRGHVSNYVLNAPRKEDFPLIREAMERSLELWPLLLQGKTEAAMLKLQYQGQG